MNKTSLVVAVVATAVAGIAYAQFPIMDRVADKVIQKSDVDVRAAVAGKGAGPGPAQAEMEQRAIQALKGDPQMRQAFFNKVSAPIVNKMFECGMIP